MLPSFSAGILPARTGIFRFPGASEGLPLLAAVLTAVSLNDFRKREIPDEALFAGILGWFARLIGSLLQGGGEIPHFFGRFLAAVLLSGIVLTLTLLTERLFRRETLGGGDLKLLFVLILYLGFQRGLLCIALSVLFGTVFLILQHGGRFPFAPALSAAAILSLISPEGFF